MATGNLTEFDLKLRDAWPPSDWNDVTVIAAVSGGPDSVALVRGLANLKRAGGGRGRLIVAHFDHQLRPNSESDATFVRSLAAKLELAYEQGAADVSTAARERGDGIEAAARAARYGFLLETANRFGARYVATGHTADDQVESVLFNILRGTSLAGLAGIEPRAAAGSIGNAHSPAVDHAPRRGRAILASDRAKTFIR